ncbi:hypothetical protein D3C87_1537430 [compost metagenome]
MSVPKPKNMAASAPQAASGTVVRISSGSRALSNCAASTRKMKTSAKAKVTAKPPCSCRYCRDSPRKLVWNPAGNCSDCACRNATAWPSGTPGAGMATSVALFNWLNCVSALASTPFSSETTVDSGTCPPVAVRTWKRSRDSAVRRRLRGACGITS